VERAVVFVVLLIGLMAAAYAAEKYNGLVKTDVTSLVTTRDGSKRTILPAPERT
jgi:hypothetical protein